jgi:hypothetical protein
MKRNLLLLFILALAGCVPSWNPFYTENDLVFDPALVGIWRPVQTQESSKESWQFTKDGNNRYQLTQTDEEGRRARFDARLLKLKAPRFLDLYLVNVEGDELKINAWAGFSLVPAHLLLKVEQIEPSLKIAVMNPDWMKTFLQQRPNALAHRVLADSNVVLTANTAELQKFILDHLNDAEFFGDPMELKRK